MKLKILYLTPGCFDKGGISRYSRFQITALQEILGTENVITLSLLGPDEYSFETPFKVDYFAGDNSFLSKCQFALRFKQMALQYRPALIWTAHLAFASLVRMISPFTKSKTILNEYGLEVWTDIGWDTYWGEQGMSAIVTDCHFTADWIHKKVRRPKDEIHVIWDCVDIQRFHPGLPKSSVLQQYGIPNPKSGINLLTLGRMSKDASHKGYERLLEIFDRCVRNYPSLNLIYAGRGDLIPILKKKVQNKGLADKVFFIGDIHEQDLPDVYRSADIFSLVSDRGVNRGEGIPLTPLEAAACGIPIIVGNQDGSQEAVVDGKTGFVVDPFDFDAHQLAIIKLLDNLHLRHQMGKFGRGRIEQNFSYEVFVDKHRSLLSRWL